MGWPGAGLCPILLFCHSFRLTSGRNGGRVQQLGITTQPTLGRYLRSAESDKKVYSFRPVRRSRDFANSVGAYVQNRGTVSFHSNFQILSWFSEHYDFGFSFHSVRGNSAYDGNSVLLLNPYGDRWTAKRRLIRKARGGAVDPLFEQCGELKKARARPTIW